jgi:hypothetical protein
MITKRSDTLTGMCCSCCEHAVIRPWGARPGEYLVCDACVASHAPVRKPVQEEFPDMSDSFWRIATADQRK